MGKVIRLKELERKSLAGHLNSASYELEVRPTLTEWSVGCINEGCIARVCG